eukprot:3335098-Rhodomonas_salina.2
MASKEAVTETIPPQRNFILQKVEEIDHQVAPYLTGKSLAAGTFLLAWVADSIMVAVISAVVLRVLYTR